MRRASSWPVRRSALPRPSGSQVRAMQAGEPTVCRLNRGHHAGQPPTALPVPEPGVPQRRRHWRRERPAPQVDLDLRARSRRRVAPDALHDSELVRFERGGRRPWAVAPRPSPSAARYALRVQARATSPRARPGSPTSCSRQSSAAGAGHRSPSAMLSEGGDRRAPGSAPPSPARCGARRALLPAAAALPAVRVGSP